MYLQSLLAVRHFIDLRSFSIGFALPMLASSSVTWWWKYFRKWCQRTKLLGLGGGLASLLGKTNSWHYARQASSILEQVQELTRVSIPVLLVTSVLALHLPSFIIGPIVYILRKVITILVPSNYLLIRWGVILFMSVPHLVDFLVKAQTEPEFYLEIFLSSLSYLERHDLPFPIGYQEHLPYLEDRVKELRTRADAVRAFSNVSELIQRSTQHTSHPIEQLVNVLSTICPSPLKYLGGSTLRDTLVVKTDGVPIRLMQVMDDYSNLLIGWTVQSISHDSGHGEWVEIVVKNTSLTKDHIDFTNLLDAPIGTVSVVHSPLSVEIPRVPEEGSSMVSSSKSVPPKSKKIK